MGVPVADKWTSPVTHPFLSFPSQSPSRSTTCTKHHRFLDANMTRVPTKGMEAAAHITAPPVVDVVLIKHPTIRAVSVTHLFRESTKGWEIETGQGWGKKFRIHGVRKGKVKWRWWPSDYRVMSRLIENHGLAAFNVIARKVYQYWNL